MNKDGVVEKSFQVKPELSQNKSLADYSGTLCLN